jgi:hypothetical protein
MGYVWTALRRVLPSEVTEDIRGMQLTKDDCGAVFDVPSKHMASVQSVMEDYGALAVCTTLPELKERFGGGGMGGGGGGYGYGNGGGFRMGAGGGRGGGGRGGEQAGG